MGVDVGEGRSKNFFAATMDVEPKSITLKIGIKIPVKTEILTIFLQISGIFPVKPYIFHDFKASQVN
ncbi:hypothetical protein [Robertmurraya kyonggiensis]|uniref:hypothetical protein n=1 Tax=Robertmurraya kyonggiensis TaxID=1037680 RepID=UPI00130D6B40|nr:hypothetical protein [Robertmurraya kyonggiensis]